MKKRALSLLLAFVMVLGLAVPVFAAEPMAPEEPVPAEAAPAAEETPPAEEPAPAAEDLPAPVDNTYVVESSLGVVAVSVDEAPAKQFNSLADGWKEAQGATSTASINVEQSCWSESLTWDKPTTDLYVYTDVPDGVTVTFNGDWGCISINNGTQSISARRVMANTEAAV